MKINEDDDVLKNELKVVFLLRRILEIPKDICCEFLTEYGDPCSWIDFCDSCSALVQKGRLIFDQMTMLEKQFKILQSQITNEMVEKFPLHNLIGDQKMGLKQTILSIINQVTVISSEDLSSSNFNKAQSSSSALASYHVNEQNQLIVKDEVDMDNFCENPLPLELCEVDHYNVSEEADPLRLDEAEDRSDTCCINVDIKEEWLQKQLCHSESGQQFNSEVRSNDNLAAYSKKTNTVEDVNKSQRYRDAWPHERGHTAERPFECDACGKEFTTLKSLEYHQRTHSGEKPYNCNYCEKSFAAPSGLKTHERIHTGDKRYKCDICGEAFTQGISLKLHQVKHTGVKPYACDTCGKAFSASMNLTRHKRIHTGEFPYKCRFCDKFFNTTCHAKIHERIHTGEKPYKCEACGKAFTALHTLAHHKNLHTGEKPYQCNTCGKAYYCPSGLTRHKETHNDRRKRAKAVTK